MSRHLLDIGDRDRNGNEGFGLVEQRVGLEDRRAHDVYLSTKARALPIKS
jgi:hypothetical protein